MKKDMVILLAEDSDFQREAAKSVLNELGFDRIIEASNGMEAFKYIQKRKVDLIISDWDMPEVDGLELFEKMKSNTLIADIPFILLTITDDKEKIIQAAKKGINHYIIKPILPKVLKKKMETIFENT